MYTLKFNQLKLISELKKRPGLWSTAHPTDRDEKLALWKEVGEAMFKDWKDCSKATCYDRVLYLQKRWRSFRDAYRREVRARLSGVRVNRSVYRYYRAMQFLGGINANGEGQAEPDEDDESEPASFEENSDEATYNHNNGDDAGGSMEIEILENEEHLESYYTDTVPDPLVQVVTKSKSSDVVKKPMKRNSRKRQRASSEDTEEVHQEMETPYTLDVRDQEREPEDSDKLFLLSFHQEMRELPLNIKMWVRAQIANVMQEAVTCHYNNANPETLMIKRNRRDSPH